jgi:GT2 family glycosyltransferase
MPSWPRVVSVDETSVQGAKAASDHASDSIAIVVLTYNRLRLLRQCVENVLFRTSEATNEIVIWDNASTDGTPKYLDSLSAPRIRVVHHPKNIGQNAYALAFPQTNSDYLIEIDDDITDAPEGWDRTLLEAFKKLPKVGFLQARLADDGYSPGSRFFYREKAHLYNLREVNGVRLWVDGPVGGGCTITSRQLHDQVGGFRQNKKDVFWFEDEAYIRDIKQLGYQTAILDELEVFHAGGAHYSEAVPEKRRYYERRRKARARKYAAKRFLLRIPLVASLNRRYRWFQPPPPVS